MSKDRNNKEYFKETFDEMHAPEGLRRKVMDMKQLDVKKMGKSVGKKLAVAAAIAAVLFAGSNGVAYAMTGSTWVETVVAKIRVNGVWQDVEMEGEVLEDGTVQYSTTLDVQDDEKVEIVLVSDVEGAESVSPELYIEMDTTTTVDSNTGVVQEDGKVYFVDGDVKIDITGDMADQIATGSYEKDGVTYQYEVKEEPGVPGFYELHISSEE